MVAMQERTQDVTVSNTASTSTTPFNLLAHEVFVGAVFPSMTAGAIGLEYSIDGGSNYAPILDPVDGDDLLVVKSGSDPGVIDISDFVRFTHSNENHKLRFTNVAQAAIRTIKVLTRG